MKEHFKLKEGDAAILFRKEGISMVMCGQEPMVQVSNAATITYALQHPLFIQIATNFLIDLETLTKKMETETVH